MGGSSSTPSERREREENERREREENERREREENERREREENEKMRMMYHDPFEKMRMMYHDPFEKMRMMYHDPFDPHVIPSFTVPRLLDEMMSMSLTMNLHQFISISEQHLPHRRIVPEEDPCEQPVKRSSSFEFLPPNMSELRVVLLGNSWSERSSVGNFILGETKFNTEEEPDCFLRERVQLKRKEVVLINTPDLMHPSSRSAPSIRHRHHRAIRHMHPQTIRRSRQAELISDPGPHVFLLVLQPEDFTEEHKLKLYGFLQLFNDRSFDHSLVLISTPREERPGFMEKYLEHPPLKDMIKQCQYRFLWQKNLELPELLTRLGQIVKENNGEHLSSDQPIEDLLHMLSI